MKRIERVRNIRSRHYSRAMKLMEEAVFDEKEVLTLLEKAIDQGDLRAAIAYANWYMFGPNSERDEKKAVDLLFIAAKGNFPEALFNLGVAHERGKGVRKDARAAYLFYLRAALAGEDEPSTKDEAAPKHAAKDEDEPEKPEKES